MCECPKCGVVDNRDRHDGSRYKCHGCGLKLRLKHTAEIGPDCEPLCFEAKHWVAFVVKKRRAVSYA